MTQELMILSQKSSSDYWLSPTVKTHDAIIWYVLVLTIYSI